MKVAAVSYIPSWRLPDHVEIISGLKIQLTGRFCCVRRLSAAPQRLNIAGLLIQSSYFWRPYLRKEFSMHQAVISNLGISIYLDPYLSLKALASYSGLSVRKLRDYLSDPLKPLPYYRVGGKIVVRRSDFDAWIARYRMTGSAEVNKIVNEVLAKIA